MRQAGDTNTVNPARYTADTGGVPAALASAAHKVTATYRYHYNNFVPIGPHAAVADIKSNSGIVYVQGQSLQGLPPNFATHARLAVHAGLGARDLVRGCELLRRRPAG